MSVVALKPNYTGAVRDAKDQFNGQQVLFIEWLGHLSISAPIAVLVNHDQRFVDFIHDDLQTSTFSSHPDWKNIDWSAVKFQVGDTTLRYDDNDTFDSLGIGHKTYLRFSTPGLNGI